MGLIQQNLSNAKFWLVISSAILMAIWPLPGTIALRHALLILGTVCSLVYLAPRKTLLLDRSSWPLWSILSFYLWLLFHLLFFTQEFDLQLKEFFSLWVRSFFGALIGLGLGLFLTESSLNFDVAKHNDKFWNKNSLITLILFLGLSGTFSIFFLRYLYEVFLTHQWLHLNFYNVPYKAKTPFVIAGALFLPLCCILTLQSIQSLLNKKWFTLAVIGILLGFFGNYFSNTRNGMAIASICLLQFLICYLFYFFRSHKKNIASSLLMAPVLVLGMFGAIKHLEHNPSWTNLMADVKVGADIDHQTYWKDRSHSSLPINQFGNEVNVSTYERAAWFTAGLRLLKENPQGYGLTHHSFGSFAMTRWPNFFNPQGNTRGATHSGWMDFALGVGIPGLLLILIPLGASWYRSLFQQGLWFSYASWTIPIMVFAYLIAEVTGAHFTEMLFFMTAFFCGVTLRYPRE